MNMTKYFFHPYEERNFFIAERMYTLTRIEFSGLLLYPGDVIKVKINRNNKKIKNNNVCNTFWLDFEI